MRRPLNGPARVPQRFWELVWESFAKGLDRPGGMEDRKARLVAQHLWEQRDQIRLLLEPQPQAPRPEKLGLATPKGPPPRISQSAGDALRLAEISPWIKAVRRSLWNSTDPPFESMDDADPWWRAIILWFDLYPEDYYPEGYRNFDEDPQIPDKVDSMCREAEELMRVTAFNIIDLLRHVLVGGPVQSGVLGMVYFEPSRFTSSYPACEPIPTPSVRVRIHWPLRASDVQTLRSAINNHLEYRSRGTPDQQLLGHIVDKELGLNERDTSQRSWEQVKQLWEQYGRKPKKLRALMMCYRRYKGLA